MIKSRLKRSRPAPALTTTELFEGMAVLTPMTRRPPVMATFLPLKLLPAPESLSVPGPALVKAVPPTVANVEVRSPASSAVTAGLVTVTIRATVPRVTSPESVRFVVATLPPKAKSALTVMALVTVRGTPSLRR